MKYIGLVYGEDGEVVDVWFLQTTEDSDKWFAKQTENVELYQAEFVKEHIPNE